MGIPSAGEVVLVPFPFSDLTSPKVRPAFCRTSVGRGDSILYQITSNSYGDPFAIPLVADDFSVGQLLVPSYARPGKLFTANTGLIVRSIGNLKPESFARVLDAVVRLFSPSK